MTLSDFQTKVVGLLSLRYQMVEAEWRAITNISGIYSPRIDIAVGPFSVMEGDSHICIPEYDALIDRSIMLINRLIEFHAENISKFRITNDRGTDDAFRLPTIHTLKDHNRNARCFLAVEIENKVSRKHLLGGAVNAAALGRVGIVVGWTPDKVAALVRLQAYWDFLGSVGKKTYRTDNLLILSPNQLLKALQD